MYAEIAAPDLFDWLQSVVASREVIDDLTVGDKVWKITYKIQRTVEAPEMDEELRELLQGDNVQQMSINAEITAEILKIEGEEGKNVIEFRQKDGSPNLYMEHVKWVKDHMQQDREEE